MSDFSLMTAMSTISVGTRKVFFINNDNLLKMIALWRRFALDYSGPITFIESSQLCRFQQCGRRRLLSSTAWKLWIVKSIFFVNDPPVVDLIEWTDGVSSPGFL